MITILNPILESEQCLKKGSQQLFFQRELSHGENRAMRISMVATGLLYLLFCAAVWGGIEEDPDLVLITGEH